MVDQDELDRLHERIMARSSDNAADRERQRALIREMQAEGETWDAMVLRAHVSRQTVRRALVSSNH